MPRQALRAKNLKVVLHLEQPAKHSTLFPRAINPAAVLQRLKQLIKAIDPHPRVAARFSLRGRRADFGVQVLLLTLAETGHAARAGDERRHIVGRTCGQGGQCGDTQKRATVKRHRGFSRENGLPKYKFG